MSQSASCCSAPYASVARLLMQALQYTYTVIRKTAESLYLLRSGLACLHMINACAWGPPLHHFRSCKHDANHDSMATMATQVCEEQT